MITKFSVLILGVALSGNLTVLKAAEPTTFPNSEVILRSLVQEKTESPTNHLYVSPIKKIGNGSFAWVYWKEKRQLILWEPFDSGKWKLSSSRRIVDLDKDVVPTIDDIKGSTYLVDKKWACTTIGDCMKNGKEYIIQK
jgi:hypothetical protein